MKTSATITFHASHNYGSSLQTYALQQTIQKLGLKNDIINFRTDKQKDIYSVITKRKGVKYAFKNLTHFIYYKPLKQKHKKFENFIKEDLVTTKEISDFAQLQTKCQGYDYYIAGSDQIWNPIPADFDWAYFLPFAEKGKKISYAASFGPFAKPNDDVINDKIKNMLSDFKNISVREKASQSYIYSLIGQNGEVVCDPTLLLDAKSWRDFSKDGIRLNKDYILFYTLFADRQMLKMAKILSKKLKLPIVVTNFTNQYDVINGFIKKYDCGPKDFLALIENAKFVLTSSFHGTVFSIIFQKPFFSIRGMKDERISTLLKNFGFEDRAVDINDIESKVKTAYEIDFSNSQKKKNELKEIGIRFLKKSLELM